MTGIRSRSPNAVQAKYHDHVARQVIVLFVDCHTFVDCVALCVSLHQHSKTQRSCTGKIKFKWFIRCHRTVAFAIAFKPSVVYAYKGTYNVAVCARSIIRIHISSQNQCTSTYEQIHRTSYIYKNEVPISVDLVTNRRALESPSQKQSNHPEKRKVE